MKKWAIGCGSAVVLVVLALFILIKVRSVELPTGRPGPEADALAREMLAAVKAEAWQETGAVAWTFRGRNEHLWDRQRHLARVRWKDLEVLIDLDNRHGRVWKKGVEVQGKVREKALAKAWAYWANDSYWLLAFTKVFDDGVSRQLVDIPDDQRGLLVTHASGGVTPGDSYLWHIGPDGRPTGWQMWVSIIPLEGMYVSWEDWQPLATGVLVAPVHKSALAEIDLTDVKAANQLGELTGGTDPFAPLFE